MPEKRRIILASSSPRRREILGKTGLSFEVDPGDYEEDMSLGLEPHRLARFLSAEKVRSIAGKYADALVIAADTFIVLRGALLGKPRTPDEARRMLMALNGKEHSVITGVTVLDTATGKKVTLSEETRVFFRRLSADEIDDYVRSGEPLDKAGAYAIQGLGAVLVKRIEGDYLNVVGLPLARLVSVLQRFGVKVIGQGRQTASGP